MSFRFEDFLEEAFFVAFGLALVVEDFFEEALADALRAVLFLEVTRVDVSFFLVTFLTFFLAAEARDANFFVERVLVDFFLSLDKIDPLFAGL